MRCCPTEKPACNPYAHGVVAMLGVCRTRPWPPAGRTEGAASDGSTRGDIPGRRDCAAPCPMMMAPGSPLVHLAGGIRRAPPCVVQTPRARARDGRRPCTRVVLHSRTRPGAARVAIGPASVPLGRRTSDDSNASPQPCAQRRLEPCAAGAENTLHLSLSCARARGEPPPSRPSNSAIAGSARLAGAGLGSPRLRSQNADALASSGPRHAIECVEPPLGARGPTGPCAARGLSQTPAVPILLSHLRRGQRRSLSACSAQQAQHPCTDSGLAQAALRLSPHAPLRWSGSCRIPLEGYRAPEGGAGVQRGLSSHGRPPPVISWAHTLELPHATGPDPSSGTPILGPPPRAAPATIGGQIAASGLDPTIGVQGVCAPSLRLCGDALQGAPARKFGIALGPTAATTCRMCN